MERMIMSDIEQFEACEAVAKLIEGMQPHLGAYVIQEFISQVDKGETNRMAISFAKKIQAHWAGRLMI